MSEPFIGEIRMCAFNYAPEWWAFCDGSLIDISQNPSLFSLLGTNFGGDGRVTFGLPDLRGRTPIGYGNGPGLTTRTLGQMWGYEENHLTVGQLPPHDHTATGNAAVSVKIPVNTQEAGDGNPGGAYLGKTSSSIYIDEPTSGQYLADTEVTSNLSVTIGNTGLGSPIDNMQPFTTVNFIIALQGVYPPRS